MARSGGAVGFIDAMLLRVKSRGRVAIASPDPLACPSADENMLSHPEDLARMAFAVRRLAELLRHAAVDRLLPPPPPKATATATAASAASAAAPAMHTGGRGGRRIIIGQPGPDALSVDEAFEQASSFVASPSSSSSSPAAAGGGAGGAGGAAFASWMRRNASDGIHMSGTCSMGPPEAPRDRAVCDSRSLLVKGVLGLRVADSSVMPTNVRANTVSHSYA